LQVSMLLRIPNLAGPLISTKIQTQYRYRYASCVLMSGIVGLSVDAADEVGVLVELPPIVRGMDTMSQIDQRCEQGVFRRRITMRPRTGKSSPSKNLCNR